MRIWLYDTKASTAEIERGCDAALAVFARWHLSAEHCHTQTVAQANGDAYGEHGCAAWREAEAAALQACCIGWLSIPPGAHMAPAN